MAFLLPGLKSKKVRNLNGLPANTERLRYDESFFICLQFCLCSVILFKECRICVKIKFRLVAGGILGIAPNSSLDLTQVLQRHVQKRPILLIFVWPGPVQGCVRQQVLQSLPSGAGQAVRHPEQRECGGRPPG